jgi:hypothetical protein
MTLGLKISDDAVFCNEVRFVYFWESPIVAGGQGFPSDDDNTVYISFWSGTRERTLPD